MGTSLTGQTKGSTYDALLKITDNGPVGGALKVVTDGLGTDSALQVSTAGVASSGTLGVTGATTLSGGVTVPGTATVTTLGVTGNATFNTMGATGLISATTLTASGNVTLATVATGIVTSSANLLGSTTDISGLIYTNAAIFRLAADATTVSTSAANLTGMVATLAAGASYIIDVFVMGAIDASLGGLAIGFTNSGGLTATDWRKFIISKSSVFADTLICGTSTAFNLFNNNCSTANSIYFQITATITVANGGTLQLQYSQGAGGGTSTVYRGSWMKVQKVA